MTLTVTQICGLCNQPLGKPNRPTTKEPSQATIERWVNNGKARATDGCWVEADGVCVHGHEAWPRYLGWI